MIYYRRSLLIEIEIGCMRCFVSAKVGLSEFFRFNFVPSDPTSVSFRNGRYCLCMGHAQTCKCAVALA